MALNKTSKFGVTEGLFDNKAQDVQDVYTRSTICQNDFERGTQGRKGYKMPRINMAFEPEVHSWIKKTARQKGVSMTDLVNNLIKTHPEFYH